MSKTDPMNTQYQQCNNQLVQTMWKPHPINRTLTRVQSVEIKRVSKCSNLLTNKNHKEQLIG